MTRGMQVQPAHVLPCKLGSARSRAEMLRDKRSSRNGGPWQILPKQVCAARHRAWQPTRSLGSSGQAHLADLSRGDAPCLGTRCAATPYRALPVKLDSLPDVSFDCCERQKCLSTKPTRGERAAGVGRTTAERVGHVRQFTDLLQVAMGGR